MSVRLGPARGSVWLVAWCVVLSAGLIGCEAFQRKFTRKPKHPRAAPTPVIRFEDYTRSMTPLDRYRKHFLMFDYWNNELIASLQDRSLSPKRFKRASKESLVELETLQGLLNEELADRLAPLIKKRATLDRRLRRGTLRMVHAAALSRDVEGQTRQIRRTFYWRDVEDFLKPEEVFTASPPEPQGEGSVSDAGAD